MDCLTHDFLALDKHYHVWLAKNKKFVVVEDVRLPPGYDDEFTRVLIFIPPDYPVSPLGIGDSRVYVPPNLKFRGRSISDIHPRIVPPLPITDFGPWAWWCYEHVCWDPMRDDLISFMEMVRADLTNPPVL